jgi:hypothetical protein
MKAGHRDAFAPLVDMTSLGLSVSPMIACTGIQKDRDEEKVDEATSELSTITSFVAPLCWRYAVHSRPRYAASAHEGGSYETYQDRNHAG